MRIYMTSLLWSVVKTATCCVFDSLYKRSNYCNLCTKKMQIQQENCKVGLVIDYLSLVNVRRHIHLNIKNVILDEEFHMASNCFQKDNSFLFLFVEKQVKIGLFYYLLTDLLNGKETNARAHWQKKTTTKKKTVFPN